MHGGAHGGNPGVLDDQQAAELLHRHLEARAQCLHALRQGRLHAPAHRLLRQPGGDGDDVRAAEGQKARSLDDPRLARRLHVELHPGALRAAARGAPERAGSAQSTARSRLLEVAARELVVLHAPPILRSRLTARVTAAPAASTSASFVKRPKLKRRLLSASRSSRPSARST